MKQTTLNDVSLIDQIKLIAQEASKLPLEKKISFLNEARAELHEISPFKNQPVDFVKWEKAENVRPNDYNPNFVASKEMGLLRISILNSGVTQPIVSTYNKNDTIYEIVDGEHRNEIERNDPKIKAELCGYLPITELQNKTLAERIAATVDHNRAKGSHVSILMAKIVKMMGEQGLNGEEICYQMGLSFEEYTRLSQVAGVAPVLANTHYARAWTVVDENTDIDAHTTQKKKSE